MRIVQGRVLNFCTLVICYYSIIASVDSVLSSPPGITSNVGSSGTQRLEGEGSAQTSAGKGGAVLIRATNPRPQSETTIQSINIYTDGSVSAPIADYTGSTARYAVVLKAGFNVTELDPLCSYASKNFGVACLQTLTRTSYGFVAEASEDQMVAFLAAAGDLVSYVREDSIYSSLPEPLLHLKT
ncbi:hypothetical protein WJX75_006982 [Coccomyxa subellipsoidea]|uniref:Uncharacterized protein n=1 Tax=Coccomyxa subellipsoidea TaxID=248742 RepID=A0ABR2YB86_9CHLO